MPIGKRWSWRYRAGVLFALMLLLQGGGCPEQYQMPPSPYLVPGVRGMVYPARQISSDGRRYYGLIGYYDYGQQRVVYEGSPEYEIIERFFRNLNNPPSAGDRSGVPGGSGTPPLPAVQ